MRQPWDHWSCRCLSLELERFCNIHYINFTYYVNAKLTNHMYTVKTRTGRAAELSPWGASMTSIVLRRAVKPPRSGVTNRRYQFGVRHLMRHSICLRYAPYPQSADRPLNATDDKFCFSRKSASLDLIPPGTEAPDRWVNTFVMYNVLHIQKGTILLIFKMQCSICSKRCAFTTYVS